VALNLDHAAVVKVAMDDQPAIDALTPSKSTAKSWCWSPRAIFRGAFRTPAARRRRTCRTRRRSHRNRLASKLQPAAIVLFSAPGGRAAAEEAGGARLREASTMTARPFRFCDKRSGHPHCARCRRRTAISAHIGAPTVVPSKVRNVVGLLRGSDPALKDTYILITGTTIIWASAITARPTTFSTAPMTMAAAPLRDRNRQRPAALPTRPGAASYS